MRLLNLTRFALTLLVASPLLTGCGHKEGDGHEHAHGETEGHEGHDHGHKEESPSGASFKAGKGVMLTDETRKILALETADITEQKLPVQIHLNVQIFGEKHHHAVLENDHSNCDVHGSGFVTPEQSAALRVGQAVQIQTRTNGPLTGVVLAVEKPLLLGESEVIVGATNATDKVKSGDFLSAVITLPRHESVPVIPRSALIRTSEGSFVYAVNGEAYYRTAVKTGAEGEQLVEITDGLLTGDAVVVKPVETLWLIELRATKGGGHSH